MGRRRGSYQKRSPEQWRQLVEDQRSSGQSVRGFARSRGICKSSLGHWSRLLRGEDGPGLSDGGSIPCRHGSRGGGLVELLVQHQSLAIERSGEETCCRDVVRLLVGAGVCLELSRLPAPEYLALVARSYDEVGS